MNLGRYLRVSTEEQAKSGLGLADQDNRTIAYCDAFGHTDCGPYVDAGVTTLIPFVERPEGERVMLDIRSGMIDGVVAIGVDRFCRDTVEFLLLSRDARSKRGGFALIAMDLGVDMGTAMGKFVGTIMAARGELERDLTSERTVAALAIKRSRGIPLGSRSHRNPVIVSAEAESRIRALRAEGLSTRGIARQLGAEGFHPPRGEQWGHSTVAAVLSR